MLQGVGGTAQADGGMWGSGRNKGQVDRKGYEMGSSLVNQSWSTCLSDSPAPDHHSLSDLLINPFLNDPSVYSHSMTHVWEGCKD